MLGLYEGHAKADTILECYFVWQFSSGALKPVHPPGRVQVHNPGRVQRQSTGNHNVLSVFKAS